MSSEKGQEEKIRLHIRNRNRERYNLDALLESEPALADHIKPNKFGDDSVDFANPIAVKLLNKALLKHYYKVDFWEFPDKNLCPPIPGRADYLHHMADLLCENNYGKIPTGSKVICFDIGVGANCIYPIIGVTEYGWNFIGSDIDQDSILSAEKIIASNESLKGKVECRLQVDPSDVFFRIIGKEEKIDMSICNPPFHASAEEALAGTRRKVFNLKGKKEIKPELNFSGISQELICDGGESKFIQNMVRESAKFAKNCFWFSTLVSKQSNVRSIQVALEKYGASKVKTIPLGTGNKSSRIMAWTFLDETEQQEWRETRWKSQETI